MALTIPRHTMSVRFNKLHFAQAPPKVDVERDGGGYDYKRIWDNNENHFGPPSQDMLAYCLPTGTKPGELSIVDVGSGNGRYALSFADQGFKEVTAIEITPTGADRIRRDRDARQYKNLKVIQEDALNLTKEHGYGKQYDVVFSSGMLEEIASQDKQRASVQNLQDLVKPGGRLVLRHCLYISDKVPPERVQQGFVKTLFPESQWHVLHLEMDPEPFQNQKATVRGGISRIQRETIVAEKRAPKGPQQTSLVFLMAIPSCSGLHL